MMKKTKQSDNHSCQFCKNKKEKAKWTHFGQYACEKHKDKLIDDGYMSEADYQTWGRL